MLITLILAPPHPFPTEPKMYLRKKKKKKRKEEVEEEKEEDEEEEEQEEEELERAKEREREREREGERERERGWVGSSCPVRYPSFFKKRGLGRLFAVTRSSTFLLSGHPFTAKDFKSSFPEYYSSARAHGKEVSCCG